MANSDSMEYYNSFSTIFRYLVLAALYIIVFFQMAKPSIQFILYMLIFILNFFTIVFAVKDMFATPMLFKSIYGQLVPNDPSGMYSPLTIFFIAIIIITGVLFICSLSMILAVFSYGKKTTNDYKSYTMTPINRLILSQFQMAYKEYITYLSIFLFFLIFAHTTGPTRQMMFNIGCVIFSIITVSISIYCLVAAIHFLKIKQYNKQLYE